MVAAGCDGSSRVRLPGSGGRPGAAVGPDSKAETLPNPFTRSSLHPFSAFLFSFLPVVLPSQVFLNMNIVQLQRLGYKEMLPIYFLHSEKIIQMPLD